MYSLGYVGSVEWHHGMIFYHTHTKVPTRLRDHYSKLIQVYEQNSIC